jgi:GNAT superfamily N-acetyltransferase
MPEVVLPLTVRDLTAEDLQPGFSGWSETHLEGTLQALDRAKIGEVDFLAVCPPSGIPVATGGVDYAKPSGIPLLWQLSVDAPLRSCGIGTILIQALEQRIRARGLTQAELGVDENRSRPRALYERLGYVATGREPGAWNEEAPDGTVTRYETTITVLRKKLA